MNLPSKNFMKFCPICQTELVFEGIDPNEGFLINGLCPKGHFSISANDVRMRARVGKEFFESLDFTDAAEKHPDNQSPG